MDFFSVASEFAQNISAVTSRDGLKDALAQACLGMGVRYFALSHHVDFAQTPSAIRIHNYPDGWEEWYDANHLGLCDPIHRASHFTAQGFYWREISRIIPMNSNDHRLLDRGTRVGLGDGITVPAHVPGESRGSCTFVTSRGTSLPDNLLLWAQTVGIIAFEGARRLRDAVHRAARPRISERQRQCIALAGRGLSNREIAQRMGIGEQTVMEHLREARARIGVGTRTQLVVSLLAAGELCLDEVAPCLNMG